MSVFKTWNSLGKLFRNTKLTYNSERLFFTSRRTATNSSDSGESSTPKPGKFTKHKRQTSDGHDVAPELKSAVRRVAKAFPAPEQDRVAWDLLKKLQEHTGKGAGKGDEETSSVSSLLSGVRVERQKKSRDMAFPAPSDVLDRTGRSADRPYAAPRRKRPSNRFEPGLFEGEAMNVFLTELPKDELGPRASLFEDLTAEELKKKLTFPVTSAYDEMIRWTDEGKMWSFPISNEDGLDDEQDIPFTEHIFFDEQLQIFPATGPIRHFMELVCVGLSKNAFMTVQQKRAHIAWYARYFDEKKEIIELANENMRTQEKALADEGKASLPEGNVSQ